MEYHNEGIAVYTKYHPAKDWGDPEKGNYRSRGSRIEAYAPDGKDRRSVAVPFEYGTDDLGRALLAVQAWVDKHYPGKPLEVKATGNSPDQKGYVVILSRPWEHK